MDFRWSEGRAFSMAESTGFHLIAAPWIHRGRIKRHEVRMDDRLVVVVARRASQTRRLLRPGGRLAMALGAVPHVHGHDDMGEVLGLDFPRFIHVVSEVDSMDSPGEWGDTISVLAAEPVRPVRQLMFVIMARVADVGLIRHSP